MLRSHIQEQSLRPSLASHEAVALWVCCSEHTIHSAAAGQLISDVVAVLHRCLVSKDRKLCFIFTFVEAVLIQ